MKKLVIAHQEGKMRYFSFLVAEVWEPDEGRLVVSGQVRPYLGAQIVDDHEEFWFFDPFAAREFVVIGEHVEEVLMVQ